MSTNGHNGVTRRRRRRREEEEECTPRWGSSTPSTRTMHCPIKWDPKKPRDTHPFGGEDTGAIGHAGNNTGHHKGPSKKKRDALKRAHVLVAAVEKATANFIVRGEEIAMENPDIKSEMLSAVEERGNMVKAARNLLSAVTRLLILADMVDVHRLMKSLKVVEDDLQKVKNASSGPPQAELKDPKLRDDLAAARAVLKKNCMMLLTASKVYVRHPPEISAAKENRDYIFRQGRSNNKIAHAIYEGPGELASALDEFDDSIFMDPLAYNEVRTRPSLEKRLESIISGAALMADSSCTRDERRERIVAECNAVRQALQDLLSEYMANTGRKEPSESLSKAIDYMTQKTKDLRRQLRKAGGEEWSRGGRRGAGAGLPGARQQLVEVANLACSMSNNDDGVKMVRYAASQIEKICPQVINAARILAARPKSRRATLTRWTALRAPFGGRSARVSNVVSAEMDNYEPGVYTERVLEAVTCLREQIMTNFADRVEMAVEALNSSSKGDIRRTVLLNRTVEELDSETEIEYEDNTYETRSKSSIHTDFDEYPEIHGINNARDAYRLVSEEEKEKIAQQVETFRNEKNKFDKEVAKWDDTGNDIIVIAKQMCMIMMEMTDFTRGKGPLKTTMDVINAAKKISESGTKLDSFAGQIADQCPESSTKRTSLPTCK
ncbi:Catenin alpha-1 [Tyrophagus putrescentiae]|nr:Catenin alpha-1 [Tyrophagus putrescentiae]